MSTSTSKEELLLLQTQQLRHQKHVFRLNYENLCKANNKNALKGVTSQLADNKLDFLGDRIKLEDWVMIINAIKHDRSLHMIAIRSRYPSKTVLDHVDDHDKARKVTKHPLIYTKHVLYNAMDALHACLRRTRALASLELEGLPLNGELLEMLIDGVSRCQSLKNLSVYRCDIGDEGVAVICKVLKYLPSVVQLDMSGCGVTALGAEMVAELLKYQSLQRCGEEWKQSLRYRVPDVDTFPGLRRVTLNHNRHIGDRGAKLVLDTLKDDSWLKALDMQNCCLSNETAVHALSLLDINTCLNVVDLRANDVSHSLEALIVQALVRNIEQAELQDGGIVDKHDWLELENCLRPRKTLSVSRPGTPPTSRCHTPVTRHATKQSGNVANLGMLSQHRPSTCMPAIWTPLVADVESLSGASVAPSGKSFEVDRLREDMKELTLELNAEASRRREAEAANALLQADLTSLQTTLEEERVMRIRALDNKERMEKLLHQLEKERRMRDADRKGRRGRLLEAGDNKNCDMPEPFADQSQRRARSKKCRSLHAAPQTSPTRKLKMWSNPQAVEEETNKIFVESEVGDGRLRVQVNGGSLPSAKSYVDEVNKGNNNNRNSMPSRASELFNKLMSDKGDKMKGDGEEWPGKKYADNGDSVKRKDGKRYEKGSRSGERKREEDWPEKACFDGVVSSRKGKEKWVGEDLNKRIADWKAKKVVYPMEKESEWSLKMTQWIGEENNF